MRVALLLMFALILPLQTSCGIVLSNVTASRSTEVTELRADSPEARLFCDGEPCDSFRSTKSVYKPSPWGYAASMVLEGACTAFAAREYDRHHSDGAQALEYTCIGLLGWDLLTLPLLPLAGGFQARTSSLFDHHTVEMEWNGERVKLIPGLTSNAGPGVFSAEKTVNRIVSTQRLTARQRLCAALHKRVPVRYQVLPLAGENTAALQEEIQQRLETDLGPSNDASGHAPDFRVEPALVRTEASVTLELRLLAGADGELGRWSSPLPPSRICTAERSRTSCTARHATTADHRPSRNPPTSRGTTSPATGAQQLGATR
jgi:hypothetical protein